MIRDSSLETGRKIPEFDRQIVRQDDEADPTSMNPVAVNRLQREELEWVETRCATLKMI